MKPALTTSGITRRGRCAWRNRSAENAAHSAMYSIAGGDWNAGPHSVLASLSAGFEKLVTYDQTAGPSGVANVAASAAAAATASPLSRGPSTPRARAIAVP